MLVPMFLIWKESATYCIASLAPVPFEADDMEAGACDRPRRHGGCGMRGRRIERGALWGSQSQPRGRKAASVAAIVIKFPKGGREGRASFLPRNRAAAASGGDVGESCR
jgi:hypothetical protein